MLTADCQDCGQTAPRDEMVFSRAGRNSVIHVCLDCADPVILHLHGLE